MTNDENKVAELVEAGRGLSEAAEAVAGHPSSSKARAQLLLEVGIARDALDELAQASS